MKDYQLAGLSFLAYMWENGQSCILADECVFRPDFRARELTILHWFLRRMGLGKTLQTLSLFAYLEEKYSSKGPHLLVCPLSVLSAWMTVRSASPFDDQTSTDGAPHSRKYHVGSRRSYVAGPSCTP